MSGRKAAGLRDIYVNVLLDSGRWDRLTVRARDLEHALEVAQRQYKRVGEASYFAWRMGGMTATAPKADRPMRVLVACEFSGVVRDAFRARGHQAFSCDVLPTETNPQWHYQMPVEDCLLRAAHGWDLLIAHPPCTYLANSGERWLKGNAYRQEMRVKAVEFVRALYAAPVARVAIENPIGHLSTAWRKPDQIIQPFQFGHPEWKSTCLWLRGLPLLVPTRAVEPDRTVGGGKKPGRHSSRTHRMTGWMPAEQRRRERARTFTGIASAMAEQWGRA